LGGYMAVGSFVFLKVQIKDIIVIFYIGVVFPIPTLLHKYFVIGLLSILLQLIFSYKSDKLIDFNK
jgi:hypothetical protein